MLIVNGFSYTLYPAENTNNNYSNNIRKLTDICEMLIFISRLDN